MLFACLFQARVQSAAVFPLATSGALVEAGVNAAFDGTNFLVGYVASSNIAAQLVSPAGELIGPAITNIGTTMGFPKVAFAGNKYLMVWYDDYASSGANKFGQIIDPGGEKIGTAFPLSGQSSGGLRGLASGGTNFLVLLEGSGNSYYGQLVTQQGALADSSAPINASPYGTEQAAVAFDGTNYLVTWNQQGATVNSNIVGQFLDGEAGLAGSNFVINSSAYASDSYMALLFDGTRYFVAFGENNVNGQGTNTWGVFGRFVAPSGNVLGGQITIATNDSAQRYPSLAFDGSSYLVSWTGAFGTTNASVEFQFFGSAGQPVGPPFTVFQAQGTNSPSLAASLFDGREYLAVATIGNPTQRNFGGSILGAFIPSSAAPPSLAAAGVPAGGQFSLQLTGTPGINYVVQAATNLLSGPWAALVTNSTANGTFGFTDTAATNNSRFYRAVTK